jgi:glycosyltransferase involved in cell wall biosynthesis
VGGVSDVVRDGLTGLLHPFGDADGLAASAVQLLQDEPRRRRFGEHARRVATERFGAARLGRDMRRLYQELLAASMPSR